MPLEADQCFAIEDEFSHDLQVSYEDNCLRFVINDTMEWADEKMVNSHLEAVSARADAYLEIGRSDEFQQAHPLTSLNKLSIALRLRHAPNVMAEAGLRKIAENLASEGVVFIYGRGGI